MNAVVNAMRIAGVTVPSVKYRIWNWLRDHNEKTSEDIKKALNLGYLPTKSIRDMEMDGIVKAYSDISRKKGLANVTYRIKRYSVTNKNGYEPTPRKVYRKRHPAAPALSTLNTKMDNTTDAPCKPITMVIKRHPVSLDDLTIKQARALFDDLKELFK